MVTPHEKNILEILEHYGKSCSEFTVPELIKKYKEFHEVYIADGTTYRYIEKLKKEGVVVRIHERRGWDSARYKVTDNIRSYKGTFKFETKSSKKQFQEESVFSADVKNKPNHLEPHSGENHTNSEKYFRFGTIERRLKNYDKAIEHFNKALEFDPNNVKILIHKAMLLNDLKRYDESIKTWHRAHEARPEDLNLLANKAIVLKNLGRNEDALKTYDRILEIDPYQAQYLSDRAKMLHILGRDEEALESYNRATEINPESEWYWLWKGNLLYEMDRKEEAWESYAKTLHIDPNDAEAWYLKSKARLMIPPSVMKRFRERAYELGYKV